MPYKNINRAKLKQKSGKKSKTRKRRKKKSYTTYYGQAQ